MTIGKSTAEDWVERLAQALTELATTQKRYRDEFARYRQQRIRMESDLPRPRWRPLLLSHGSRAASRGGNGQARVRSDKIDKRKNLLL